MAEGKTFVSDDGYSTVPGPVGPEGALKDKKADVKKEVDPEADSVPGAEKAVVPAKTARKTVQVEETEEVVSIDEAVAALFEGEDLSEEFKSKAEMLFTAAINEEVSRQVEEKTANLAEQFEESMNEAVSEEMEKITEALSGYLDYVVEEWMKENELAVEAGIKVEMAESFMEGLKGLFYEHNVKVDDEIVDVVAALEEELESVKKDANEIITESIDLKAEISALKAERVFMEAIEGLTLAQADRLQKLAEKLSFDNLETYAEDLETLKETFLNVSAPRKTAVESVSSEEEGEILTEDVAAERNKTVPSSHPSVSAYVAAFSSMKK